MKSPSCLNEPPQGLRSSVSCPASRSFALQLNGNADMLLCTHRPSSENNTRCLLARLEQRPCRTSLQLQAPKGSVAMREWAEGQHQDWRRALREDPWRASSKHELAVCLSGQVAFLHACSIARRARRGRLLGATSGHRRSGVRRVGPRRSLASRPHATDRCGRCQPLAGAARQSPRSGRRPVHYLLRWPTSPSASAAQPEGEQDEMYGGERAVA